MSKNTPVIVRRLFYLTLICVTAGFGIKAFILNPLYVNLASNIAFQDKWWVNVLYFLTDGGLIDLAVFAICYPATMYAIRRNGFKASIRLPITFATATLLKFVFNFVMNALTDNGALPDMQEFVSIDLPMILQMFAMELFQYILVILIALLVRWMYNRRAEISEGMRYVPRKYRVDYPMPPEDFPFVKLYARRNALQRGALLTALVITLGRVIMHFIYQWTLYSYTGTSEGWVVMAIDLCSDIMIGVIFYFISLLLMMRFYRKEG